MCYNMVSLVYHEGCSTVGVVIGKSSHRAEGEGWYMSVVAGRDTHTHQTGTLTCWGRWRNSVEWATALPLLPLHNLEAWGLGRDWRGGPGQHWRGGLCQHPGRGLGLHWRGGPGQHSEGPGEECPQLGLRVGINRKNYSRVRWTGLCS